MTHLGQIERVGDRRSEIKRLNLGGRSTIASAKTITVTQTAHELTGNKDVETILGGMEGDVLILFGKSKVKDKGNIDLNEKDHKLDKDGPLTLVYYDEWVQI